MPPSRPSPSKPRAICAALRHARKCLCQRIAHAAATPDAGFAHGYVCVVAAVEAGFRHEEVIMEMLGYAQLREHRAENAVVLSALHRVLPDVEGGDCALGRQVLTALLDVVELHRLSTDLAVSVAVQPLAPGAHRKAARPALTVTTWRHRGR